MWERTDLETLVLADNELSEISNHIGHLKKLRMLDLGHNRLTQVPDALADLDGLTDFLYLHDNQLTSLPASLARLTKLRYLNISENAFEIWPESISSYDQPDRVAGIRQSADVASGFRRSFGTLARASPEKQPTDVTAGVDCGTPTTATHRSPWKPVDPFAPDHGYDAPAGETRSSMGEPSAARVARNSRSTRLRGVPLTCE